MFLFSPKVLKLKTCEKQKKRRYIKVDLLKCREFTVREHSSLEGFLLPKHSFTGESWGAERKKKKSTILGTTLQKCRREVQTSEWLFISCCQWLNMNSPFTYDPGLADDLLVHDFHFFSSHWHKDIKFTLCSILRWNDPVKGWGVHLQTSNTIYTLVHSASQRPHGPSLSQFRFPLKSHWTVSVASRAKKSSELIPFDHSFLSPPREPWFPDAVFSLLSHANID